MIPLPIFPEGGLASSVITTVWVGVWVLCFFNLRYGWVLSGLVVPGYLVPLIIVKPIAALVIVIEAILAYLIVWLFSERIGRGRWPSLFGRDRFMALVLASIAVRLALDGYLLPEAADWIEANWNRNVYWQSDLQSFGLVIISLLANQFWKPGLARGLVAMVVVTAITWVVVRYGLMELTNFRMSGVTYLYEGLASSVLASPKAYMILVLTALYASHMNVKYGWDFSGILIPALIALQWYQPTKIVTSFIEAVAIYFIARQLLKTPWLANATMEGANKILLFFNISFALKLIVGHALVWLAWDVKTTDFYGFGYLLSTLLAMKAHDKDIFPRLMRSTLQVSFVGAAAGNLAGFALALLLPAAALGGGRGEIGPVLRAREDALLVAAVGDAHFRSAANRAEPLSPRSAGALADAIELLEAGLPPAQVGATASSGGWRVEVLAPRKAALVRDDGGGRDLLLFDGTARRDLVVRVDNAAAAPGLASTARAIMEKLEARWLMVTIQPAAASPGRGVAELVGTVVAAPQLAVVPGSASSAPSLSLAGASATAVDIDRLRALWPDLAVAFSATRTAGGEVGAAEATLSLPTASFAAVFSRGSQGRPRPPRCSLPAPARGEPRVRSLEELLFLRSQIVLPVLDAIDRGTEPVLASRAAEMLGLTLTPCTRGGETYLLLTSANPTDGAYLFAREGDPSIMIQSALRQERHGVAGAEPRAATVLATAGLRLQQAANARLLALASRELAYDGSQATAFGIVTQATLGRLGNAPALVIQLRPRPQFGSRAIPAGKTIISPDRLNLDPARRLAHEALLRRAGFDPVTTTRAARFAGYESFPLAALSHLNQSLAKRYLVVFLPQEGA